MADWPAVDRQRRHAVNRRRKREGAAALKVVCQPIAEQECGGAHPLGAPRIALGHQSRPRDSRQNGGGAGPGDESRAGVSLWQTVVRQNDTPHSATAAQRHKFRMLISRAGRRCSSRYSRYGVSTSSIHFMNARTRRDRLLRWATTRDTAIARRRKSGMISTSAPLSKYWPIPKSGA